MECILMSPHGYFGQSCSPLELWGEPPQGKQWWNVHFSELTNARGFLNASCPCSLAAASTLTRKSLYFALRSLKYAALVHSGRQNILWESSGQATCRARGPRILVLLGRSDIKCLSVNVYFLLFLFF